MKATTKTTIGILAAAGLALAACESAPQERTERPVTPTLPFDPARRPYTEPLTRAGGPMDPATSAMLLSRQKLRAGDAGPSRVEPGLVDTTQGELRRLKYTARDAAAEDVVRALVGEFLGRPFLIDPKLKEGKQTPVTIDVDAEVTNQDVEDILGAIATLYGWTIERRGELTVVGAASNMSRSPVTPLLEAAALNPTDAPAVRVFRLRHVAPKEATDALKEFLSEGGKAAFAGRSVLVVDRMSQLNRIARLLEAVDTAAFDGAEVWTYALSHEKAADAARVLTSLAQGSGLAGSDNAAVAVVPLPRGNRIMVVSRDPSVQPMVRQWVEMVDAPPGQMARQRYLYRVQHWDPGKLQSFIRSTFADRMERDTNDARSEPNDSGMRIIVDPEEELMVIVATPRDYAEVLSVLERVDVARQQVAIQTVIAEVNLTNGLQFGVEYFLSQDVDGDVLELIGNLTPLGPADAIAAGSAFFLSSDGFALIKALKTETDVKIMQAPSLVVRDRDQAMIQVGGEVPVLQSVIETGGQTGGNTDLRNQIEYRDTGVILTIQPRVNETGDVTLTIEQEITDVVAQTTEGISSPAFTTRRIQTTVVVPHGKTLLLGGIVSNSTSRSRNKIPLLGDIPIAGLAFTNINDRENDIELVLTITPSIINSPRDGVGLASEFLRAAHRLDAAVRDFSGALPGDLLEPLSPVAAPVNPAVEPGEPATEPALPAATERRRKRDAGRQAFGQVASLVLDSGAESRLVADFLAEIAVRAGGGVSAP